MKLTTPFGDQATPPGFKDLDRVTLNPRNRELLDNALAHCNADPATKNRMLAEATELLALAQIAPPGRISVDAIDMRERLQAMLRLQVPVACQPDENNEPVIFPHALVGFTYPNEGFQRPLPGYAFFQILMPRPVWLPQIKQPEQALCIAPQVAARTRTAILLLRLYGALSMQSIQIDIADAAGMFQPGIARWWQENLHRVPLTKTALLEPDTH